MERKTLKLETLESQGVLFIKNANLFTVSVLLFLSATNSGDFVERGDFRLPSGLFTKMRGK